MNQENISFFIDDNYEMNNIELLNSEYIFEEKEKEKEKEEEDYSCYTKLVHYDINYTVKQLLQICEYYGISKDLRISKCNKSDILNTLIIYENNIENQERVNKRKTLWYYINELKNDKFMKKYVLWN